ncbi:unnamed protein product [Notodromas monacha]|uniref:Uncharacterized protein n=1 Tax=Notodromas monacha TaxID=399045 RepID=A0A7R9BWM3_9CRUS|nr:unnamed protein product [Notodromas monacha]CAG0922742.1 unnamed protein product [Notodromas monacha]
MENPIGTQGQLGTLGIPHQRLEALMRTIVCKNTLALLHQIVNKKHNVRLGQGLGGGGGLSQAHLDFGYLAKIGCILVTFGWTKMCKSAKISRLSPAMEINVPLSKAFMRFNQDFHNQTPFPVPTQRLSESRKNRIFARLTGLGNPTSFGVRFPPDAGAASLRSATEILLNKASYGNNQCAKLTISKGGRGRQIAQLISCKIDRERGSGNQEMRKEGRNRIASRRMLLCRMNNDHR